MYSGYRSPATEGAGGDEWQMTSSSAAVLKGGRSTVRSRYKRQLIRLNMKKKWPLRTGMGDSRPIFLCKRFS